MVKKACYMAILKSKAEKESEEGKTFRSSLHPKDTMGE